MNERNKAGEKKTHEPEPKPEPEPKTDIDPPNSNEEETPTPPKKQRNLKEKPKTNKTWQKEYTSNRKHKFWSKMNKILQEYLNSEPWGSGVLMVQGLIGRTECKQRMNR